LQTSKSLFLPTGYTNISNLCNIFAVVGRIGVLAVPQTGNRLYAGISNYWVNL
jgi:hypothetical protein